MHSMSPGFQLGLAGFFLICACINFGFANFYKNERGQKNAWGIVGFIFLLHALLFLMTGSFAPKSAPILPESIVQLSTKILNHIWGPIIYFVGSTIAFICVLQWRKTLTSPPVAIGLMNAFLLLSGWAMTNEDFRSIITKEDNVPIVMLIFSVGFFSWLGLRRAVINDGLIAANKPVLEKDDEKVLVWPDLVYTELICMVIATAALIVWSLGYVALALGGAVLAFSRRDL